MSRIYDRELPCGCLISSDGGGGLIPCHAPISQPKLFKLHKDSWQEWIDSKDYQLHIEEIKTFNT